MSSQPAPHRLVTEADIAPLNEALENRTMDEIIRWAHERFGRRLCLLSAFQKAGCVLCHRAAALGLQEHMDVVFVDTGVNFPETLETVERIRSEYGLNIVTLHPARTMEQQCREAGVLYITPEGQKQCCHLRKKEPLLQIKGRYSAMLGSLRRSSGGRRAAIPPLALDTELNLIRVYPMFRMTTEEMNSYIERHNVIYNSLHDQGYPTVSCNRCTTPVLEGEDERAGRWRHLEHADAYCNINSTDRLKHPGTLDSVRIPTGEAENLFGAGI